MILATVLLGNFQSAFAVEIKNNETWKEKPKAVFSEPEKNFKTALKFILERFVDKNLSEEELYRLATGGMLAALNPGDENWNKLLPPNETEDMQISMTGKLSGIGATLKTMDESLVHIVQNVLPDSAALKAGIKKDDILISVDGQKVKGKKLREVVGMIRGKEGTSVSVKVLREDKFVTFNVKRETVALPIFTSKLIDQSTGFLTIGAFTSDAAIEVSKKLKNFEGKNLKKLIIDSNTLIEKKEFTK